MSKKIDKKQLIMEIEHWIRDFEKLTGMCYGDDSTLEGSAYMLFNEVLRILKK